MRMIFIAGLSGSGKSITLKTFEDYGYYCIDNAPTALLPELIRQCITTGETRYEQLAIGVSAHSKKVELDHLLNFIKDMKNDGHHVDLLFINADKNTLLKRYSETRRKHPLSDKNNSLIEAIDTEIETLSELAIAADLQLDSSQINVRQLRSLIQNIVIQNDSKITPIGLTVVLQSFGFKYGSPNDSDYMFDVRCLPNPYWQPQLRELTGHDDLVQQYLSEQDETVEMIKSIQNFMRQWIPYFNAEDRSYLTFSIGCTGGQHRSVYCVNQLAKFLQQDDLFRTIVRHRELEN